MTDSFVPSLREYAAVYQIDGRRLSARQVLMHPGPVNRGVELAAEVIDSPAGRDRPAGRGRRRRPHGRALRAARRHERAAARHLHPGARPRRMLDHRDTPPADVLIKGAHVLDPRAGIDAKLDVLVRDGEIAELGDRARPTTARSSTARASTSSRASSTRTCTCACPGRSTRRTSRPARARRPPAASSPSWRCRTRARPSTPPRSCAACARPPAARRASRSASWPASRTGLQGDALTEMAELRSAGALGFTDDGKPVYRAGLLRKALQYQKLVGGIIALHEEDPTLSGEGVMHEGEVSARLGLAGIPSISESTLIARDAAIAALRERPHPHPAPERARVGRGRRRGQGARRADHLRGQPAPPHAHARDPAREARHAAEDEPAAALGATTARR